MKKKKDIPVTSSSGGHRVSLYRELASDQEEPLSTAEHLKAWRRHFNLDILYFVKVPRESIFYGGESRWLPCA